MSTNRFDMTQTKPRRAGDSQLLYISSAKYGGDWHSSPHSHQCTELFYVVGGTGGFKIENDVFQVGVHDLVVVNPRVQHTEVSWNSSPLEYIVLGVEGLELSAQENREDPFFILNFQNRGDTVLNCMRIMLQEIEKKKPGFESVCQNLLQVLAVLLMRETACGPTELAAPAGSRECSAVKWYIDAHFKENITLDRLAQVAGVNKYYLAHSFTEEYGIPPIKYLNKRRIEESKILLRSTDLSLGRIVQMLGFSSGSYFAQMFRRYEGTTPTAYREETRIR